MIQVFQFHKKPHSSGLRLVHILLSLSHIVAYVPYPQTLSALYLNGSE